MESSSTAIKEKNQDIENIINQELIYSDPIARMREALLASPYEGDIERARYYTRAYKRTEGESAQHAGGHRASRKRFAICPSGLMMTRGWSGQKQIRTSPVPWELKEPIWTV